MLNTKLEEPAQWPEWVVASDDRICEALTKFSEMEFRLRSEAEHGYTHRHIEQSHIRHVHEMLVQTGHVDSTGKGLQPAPKDVRILEIYRTASPIRLLTMFVSAKRMTLAHLLSATRSSVSGGNLLVALICMRSIIEHIAQFDDTIKQLQRVSYPVDLASAASAAKDVDALLTKCVLGNRVDWVNLVAMELDDLKDHKKIEYKPDSSRLDRTAKQILNCVDGLERKVQAIRATYDILSEYAHPNFGMILSLSENTNVFEDHHHIQWVDRQLSLNAPIAAFYELKKVYVFVFCKLKECLEVLDQLFTDSAVEELRLRTLVQLAVTEILRVQGDLVDANDDCPCASGSKVEVCCSKRT